MNSTAIVYQTEGFAHQAFNGVNATQSNYWVGSGLFISQPVVDDTPYRVKGTFIGDGMSCYLFVGRGPANPTGVNDLITDVVAIPLTGAKDGIDTRINDVINIEGLPDSHPDFQKPLAFGYGISVAAGSGTAAYSLSVQNLAKTAPQFAASMS